MIETCDYQSIAIFYFICLINYILTFVLASTNWLFHSSVAYTPIPWLKHPNVYIISLILIILFHIVCYCYVFYLSSDSNMCLYEIGASDCKQFAASIAIWPIFLSLIILFVRRLSALLRSIEFWCCSRDNFSNIE